MARTDMQAAGGTQGMAYRLAPLSVGEAERNSPGAGFVERMRSQFPIEREMDMLLTRKLNRRSGPPFAATSLAQMSDYLTALLRAKISGPFKLSNQRWLAGGASKIQLGCTLNWDKPDQGPTVLQLVVRMEPSESVNTTSRSREFQLLNAFRGVVPVPETYWLDADGEWFPEPALVYAFCAGVTKPKKTASGQIAGIGTNFGPELRRRLAPQFVKHLAAIHAFDVAAVDAQAFSAFDSPSTGTTESALLQLNRARRIWEEDRGEEFPLVEVAANWLERNLPRLDRVSVVHGDYRSGNFLFDEDTLEITAVLDWERGYLGDRHRDLAWTANHAFGHLAEDGKTFLASGLVPLEEFFAQYEQMSGLSVDRERLRYYTIFNHYQLVVTAIGSGYRVVRLGKTHQDILLASVEPVGYGVAEELRKSLEGVL